MRKALVLLVWLMGTACAVHAQRPIVGPSVFTAGSSPTVVPITAKGAALQSSNLFEFKDSSGSLLSSIHPDGAFVGPVSVTGTVAKGILYVAPSGLVSTTSAMAFDPATLDVTFTANQVSISDQFGVYGIARFGGGLEFTSNPTMGLSLAGGARIRDNTGTLQLSNNGAAFSNILTAATAGVTSITGTANQVIASSATGAVTLSTPQSIGTGSTPTFAGVVLNTAAMASGSAALPSVFGSSATTTGLFWTAAPLLGLSVNGNANLEADGTNDATNTAILIYSNGSLKRVVVGAVDSCTAGFRCLAVAN